MFLAKYLSGYQTNGETMNSSLLPEEETKNDRAVSIDPMDLKCPITYEYFRDPVNLPSGRVVERSAAEELVREKGTNDPFDSKIKIPKGTKFATNTIIRNLTNSYVKKHGKESEQYKEHPEKIANAAPVAVSAEAEQHNNIILCESIFSNKYMLYSACFIITGGFITGMVFAGLASPCHHLDLNNLTGDTLDFTYSTYSTDNTEKACIIAPWQNVSNGKSINLDRDDREHCTFYLTESNIQIRTTAFTMTTEGKDANGCSIWADKAYHKKYQPTCTFNLYKDCPSSASVEAIPEEFVKAYEEGQKHYNLRGSFFDNKLVETASKNSNATDELLAEKIWGIGT